MRLVLLRHAEAEEFGASDAERVLTPRGRTAAAAVGTWLVSRSAVPDLAVVSPAARARETPVESRGTVEVGRPPGMAHGSPIDASIAVNVPSMPLPAGRYEWRLELGEPTFNASFQAVAQQG
jgi:hypothetical protein